MVLKSGTNDFHGGIWEFNRNEAYNANNYFNNLAGQQRSKFRLNNFGGNIGGPLVDSACVQRLAQQNILLCE